MTDIEAKALALVNEVFMERCLVPDTYPNRAGNPYHEALCRAIERLEATEATEASHAEEMRELKERFDAFRQEVSDAAQSMETAMRTGMWHSVALDRLKQFILPKPDPLAEADWWVYECKGSLAFRKKRSNDFPGWTETPLYAFPTPPAGGSDEQE